MMLIRKKAVFLFIFFASFSFLAAEEFRYKFNEGDSYRINSIVNEDVYVNMHLSHNAEITNRITVNVSNVEKGKLDSALFTSTFMTSEKNSNKSFAWSKEYPSVFVRDALGKYTISGKYFMPVVRDVPVFPMYDLKPGDTWKGSGHEAHDLRDAFGLEEPFIVPFDVDYTYEGPVEKDGKTLHLIKAEYKIVHTVPDEIMKNSTAELFPVKTIGVSNQTLYWDNELGNLPYYTEEFSIRLILNSGVVLDYVGTAKAEIIEFKQMDKKKTSEDLKKEIDNLGLENTDVKETDEGVTISIENIQFKPDSAILLDSEKEKLKQIGDILRKFPERDLLVSGHTALAGTKQGRQTLSEERASAVANYLIDLGVKDAHRVFTQGWGAEKPIAPNDTEENKARNRRVEITILEK